ncbi:MAG: spore germination protein [Ruminococcus sp.]|nr:spore germination protein [Ruminococcus sp.]
MNNSLKENINELKRMFNNSADFTVRDMKLKSQSNINAAIITIEGMCSKEVVAISVINPLLEYDFENADPEKALQIILKKVLTSSEIVEVNSLNEAVSFSTSGFAVLAVDGASKMLAIGTQGFSFRSVSEPESEVVQRGSREGFTEPLRINMTLIRRRIKSPDLVFETVTVGSSSQTQLMICYLQKRVSENILKEVRKRLAECDLKTVLASGYLSDYLEDKGKKSLFSGVGISERPDTVCGKLTEGRVAILVDGTPAVIVVPRLFVEEFQSVDDYSNRPYYAAFIRILKYISFFAAVFLPGLYTAFAQFHPEYFPTGLLIKTSEALLQTPLPVTLEVILIIFLYEIMREAGLRIPKPLGHAVSIVGALVIGESAVSSGIISSSSLMVVAIAAICSYVTSALYPPIMVLRFAFVIVGGIFGLWGIVLLTCVVIINMCGKTSFGVPYMSSLAPFSMRRMRDVFVRTNWRNLGKYTIKVQKFPETEENDA